MTQPPADKVAPEKVEYLRYRGFGWPGFFSTRLKGGEELVVASEHREYD